MLRRGEGPYFLECETYRWHKHFLSDVFEDDLQQLGNTAKYVDADHSLVRFYIPNNARWPNVARQVMEYYTTLLSSHEYDHSMMNQAELR